MVKKMHENKNIMILNDINIGVSKIELDKSDLRVIDKSGRYCLRVFLYYNWKDINNIKIKEKKCIDFDEYILLEDNDQALILPTKCYVEKITNESLCFYFKFENMSETIHYMNQINCFSILPRSLEVKAFIYYKDAIKGLIKYEF